MRQLPVLDSIPRGAMRLDSGAHSLRSITSAVAHRYLITAFAFFVAGGLVALLMRVQLSHAGKHVVGPDLYNQLFTMHGSTMMFLFAVPVMEAVAIYLVPSHGGHARHCFSRLTAFSYWIYVAGGILLWVAFALNIGPDAGWFAYTPLSGPQYSPGKRVDMWAQMITYTELSGLAVAISIIGTILKQRAPACRSTGCPCSYGPCW